MPARKLRPEDEKPQRDRFTETAREIGASEDPEEFARAFDMIVTCHPMSQRGSTLPEMACSNKSAKAPVSKK